MLPSSEAVAAMEASLIEAGFGEQALSALARRFRRSGWNPLHYMRWRAMGVGSCGRWILRPWIWGDGASSSRSTAVLTRAQLVRGDR